VDVTISPAALNAESQGNWVTVGISTHGWPASDIVIGSLTLDDVAVALDGGSSVEGDATGGTLTVKFPRAPFGSRPDGNYTPALTGQRADGVLLEGHGALTVFGNSTVIRSRKAQPHDLRVVASPGARTAIAFKLDQPSEVIVDVIDLQGRTVARIARETLSAGSYQRDWPGSSSSVRAGMYLVRLRTPTDQAMVRLPVIR